MVIRIFDLRILIKASHVRMRGRGVEVVVVFLDVLAVISFVAGQAEQALLENRIAPVPQRQRKAQPLVIIGDAAQPVLAPAIGARPRMIVRKILPGFAGRTVVLADGAPLALAEVRSPSAPVAAPRPSFDNPIPFSGHSLHDYVTQPVLPAVFWRYRGRYSKLRTKTFLSVFNTNRAPVNAKPGMSSICTHLFPS